MPGALLFPMLLWLAARCQPVFAAAGAFIAALAIVLTTIFGIGHFGDSGLPVGERILQAQAIILVVTLGAYVLAALFAERREAEARLARFNILLERERDNKLMNLQVIGASIAHELKQPLTAIAANGSAALALLDRAPSDLHEAQAALRDIVGDSHRASEALDGIRGLFRMVDQGWQPIDINEITLEVLQSIHGEFKEHGIVVLPELATEIPPVNGNRGQLQQVVLNLIHNALEAMDTTTDRTRILWVKTKEHGDSIAMAVQDSGPGIDPNELEEVFDAFFTTKSHGMGLGLAISRMIVERHGGEITASSDGKNGALFQVVLPIQPGAKTAIGA